METEKRDKNKERNFPREMGQKRVRQAHREPVLQQKTEREAVIELLYSVFEEGVFLHLALRRLFTEAPYFDTRKRAFITKLSHGTVERYIQLDYFIRKRR